MRLRLSSWYFCYFAFLGAFVTYFGLYLQQRGMSPWQIGVLLSIHPVLRLAGPLFWGWWADRRRARAPVVRFTLSASLMVFLLLFPLRDFWTFFAVLVLLSFFWTAALPLVEALTLGHLNHRVEGYGAIRLWGSIGFICAVQGVGVWLDAFPVDSLLGVCAALLLANWLVSRRLADGGEVPGPRPSGGLRQALAQPRVRALLGACFLMSAAHAPLYVFYSIHLVDHGYSKTAVGTLWALGVVAEILVFLAMPRLLSRFALGPLLVVTFLLASLRFLLIGWGVAWPAVAAASQILHGASFGACHATAMAALSRWFPRQQQGQAQALYSSLSYGGGSVVGGLASGYGWQHWGAGPTYTLAALFALAGAGVVARGLGRE